jgi:hypothetical protein
MTGVRRRRHAGVLLLVTAVLWLHQWLPVLLVAGWVAWLILHKRIEGGLGKTVVRLWRRAWPPPALVLIPLLAANALAYWVYAPFTAKLLPVALNVLALSILLLGGWWTPRARAEQPGIARAERRPGPASATAMPRRPATT